MGGNKQCAKAFLMIEPVAFGYNAQTAVNNYFQNDGDVEGQDIQGYALSEFEVMVEKLRSKDIEIIVVRDNEEKNTPDSIFPNNWVSFHSDGRVVLYPMFAINRRDERRPDIIKLLSENGFIIGNIIDYTRFEDDNRYLEGTGSMILDHINKIVYAAISTRTDKELFLHFCDDFGFVAIPFTGYQTFQGNRLPVYHTNVMMCIADNYAVICKNAIDNIVEREIVVNSLINSNKEIIDISEDQMAHFAGNMLQVENKYRELFVIMSQSAFDILNKEQIDRLSLYNQIITISVPTIEKYGGGSVRCMMAEVFNENVSNK